MSCVVDVKKKLNIQFLKTWLSWIRASWYNYESNQQYATILVINLIFMDPCIVLWFS